MIYCFMADGFEELEAIGAIDMLRRSGAQLLTVGIGKKLITGAHGITIMCDCEESDVKLDCELEGVILPGGMPGTLNLEASDTVQAAIDFAAENDRLICAICAAPSILGHKGLLKGRCAIAYPGFEGELEGAEISKDYVVRDKNIITAKGAGVAADFGLEIVGALKGKEKAEEIRKAIQRK